MMSRKNEFKLKPIFKILKLFVNYESGDRIFYSTLERNIVR
jgi:hypothetical protein